MKAVPNGKVCAAPALWPTLWIMMTMAMAMAVALPATATAQYRDGDTPVVTPVSAPAAEPPFDPVPAFSQAYRLAGHPVVMLLWNRSLSDQTQAQTEQRKTITDSARGSRQASTKTTSDRADSATLTDEDASAQRKRTIVTGNYESGDNAAPNAGPQSASALMLQRAFMAELQRGGVRFVDRTMAVRTTAATAHRAGGDRQLIEADAMLKHAQLVMEVLPVADKRAPAGHAFDVRTRRVADGRELAAVYTHAMPSAPPQRPGGWVAGKDGYEFRHPLAPPPPNAVELGQALARDVMLALGGRLHAESRAPK